MMKKFLMVLLTVFTCVLLDGCGSSELAEKTGMNEEQEKAAIAVFNANGITGELENITKYKDNPPMFAMKYGNYGEILFSLTPDKQIAGIMYGPETVYRNGKAANKISDLLITNDERTDYTYAAWNVVANNLKNPNSADYPAMPTVSRHGDIVLVIGDVDAQNSFGATVRSTYRVKMQLPDKKILEFSMKSR
jgi:hypothetical protein